MVYHIHLCNSSKHANHKGMALTATTLPRFIVLKSYYDTDKGYVKYKANEGDGVGTGTVVLGEDESVFSTLVRIEAERATSAKFSDHKYVHLRFSHSNKYWARSSDSKAIVAESRTPEEDTSKASCTLFEISWVDGHGDGVLYLIHVQSGGRVRIDDQTKGAYVDEKSVAGDGYLNYVDWDSLVELPLNVAFKGDNGKYLKAFLTNALFNVATTLQFSSEDANEVYSGHQVELMPDGHVRIRSVHSGGFWSRFVMQIVDAEIISADTSNEGGIDALFWPVKIDDNTIALRHKSSSNFCNRSTVAAIESILVPGDPTITNQARLVVQELVLGRKIYSVRYRMEDARIFGETPFLAGTTTVTNESQNEGSMEVAITYTDEKSYSFSRSVSISAGITTTIKASIQVSYSISGTFEWNDTTTTTTSITATGSVPVPARTIATVSYVGTKGSCNVPFSYTKQDMSSTDGHVYESDEIDGIYNGVNCYNFNFVIEKTAPLDP